MLLTCRWLPDYETQSKAAVFPTEENTIESREVGSSCTKAYGISVHEVFVTGARAEHRQRLLKVT